MGPDPKLKHRAHSKSRMNAWKNVTPGEIHNWIAITILMGLNHLPSIPDYWSANVLYHNPVYNTIMSRNRYQIICGFIHFNDNAEYDPQDPNRDKLYKTKPLLDYLNEKFQTVYSPSQAICIDEQLMLHKGRLHFRQYIPNKRARFGIKLFHLCDETGYLYKTEVYVGNNPAYKNNLRDEAALGKTGAIVMRLMEPFLDVGHQLYLDNWYTSFPLFKKLLERKTPACETVRKNRARFPVDFTTKKMVREDTSYVVNAGVIRLRYKDKKDVYFLSTLHRPKLVSTPKKDREGNVVIKEQLVDDYNQKMGYVDKNDAVTHQHSMVRKSHKWTTKMALHLFEEALFNAHVIFSWGKKIHRHFLISK